MSESKVMPSVVVLEMWFDVGPEGEQIPVLKVLDGTVQIRQPGGSVVVNRGDSFTLTAKPFVYHD